MNGIQIYRPFIVRAGQQEGLSFIHGEFVEQIFFSSGGFDARYGDVLSSVLDVRYREPIEFGASGQISLMGAQAHVEGLYNGRRGNYILGARYRANSYLLNSLPTKGDYNPTFFDVQGVSNYYLDYNGTNSYKKLLCSGIIPPITFCLFQHPEQQNREPLMKPISCGSFLKDRKKPVSIHLLLQVDMNGRQAVLCR
ncbi:MAG: hypothetical protein IPM77_11540 [Crocinitomicaceae bacterium]|nr:hypothetical protein [Crocinitomicaceae bacterium]